MPHRPISSPDDPNSLLQGLNVYDCCTDSATEAKRRATHFDCDHMRHGRQEDASALE